MNSIDLQELVDRELRQLPYPKAPDTLLPRVMAATRVPARTAGAGWSAWPAARRIAAAVALCGVAVGAWMLAPLLQSGLAVLGSFWAPVSQRSVQVAQSAGEAATLTRVLWQVLLEPVATYLSALAISLTLACAVLWALVERFALGGASHQ